MGRLCSYFQPKEDQRRYRYRFLLPFRSPSARRASHLPLLALTDELAPDISLINADSPWGYIVIHWLNGQLGVNMSESELSLTGEQVDLSKYIEDAGGIHGLRDVDRVRGWNNIEYGAGLSGKNTPSTGLSMNKAFIPPGGIAKAHIHVDFDVMIFLLKGSVRHEFGPGCKKSVVHSAGDMFYIEPGLPHEVFNCSDTDWVEAIVARSDASEWQNIVPYDRNSE